jgi:uncharacterized protein
MRALLGTLVAAVLVYVALCVLVFAMQRRMLYFPPPGPPPADAVEIATDAGTALLSVRRRDSRDAVLYLGGNAEPVAYGIEQWSAAFPDRAIYALHYPGYSGRPGSPSEAALTADVLALHDRLQREHRRIAVVGRSLGSLLAVRLAAERPTVERLVLITPFDSVEALASRFYAWLPVRWLLLDRYRADQHAPRVSVPTLLIAASADDIAPPSHARALLQAFAPGVARLEVIDGAGHNDISLRPGFWQLLEPPR